MVLMIGTAADFAGSHLQQCSQLHYIYKHTIHGTLRVIFEVSGFQTHANVYSKPTLRSSAEIEFHYQYLNGTINLVLHLGGLLIITLHVCTTHGPHVHSLLVTHRPHILA